MAVPLNPRDHDAMPQSDALLTDLLEQARRDHARWINGDAGGYTLPDDGTILGAVGGYARGGAGTAERQAAVAAHWLRGEGDLELLNGGVSGDLAWLTFIERSRVLLRDDDAERRWDLRVTEVFRRAGGGWERVHRHADPLVDRRSVVAAADLQA
jgi:ketosteroid isomerase-like protein